MENWLASWSGKSSELPKGVRILPSTFYQKKTQQVAQELLGKILIHIPIHSRRVRAVRITETEAYDQDDPASHSFRGPTLRSAPMFESGGIAYVYLIYGKYDLFNVVTEKEGTGAAVLIRAGENLISNGSTDMGVAQGPGKFARHLKIGKRHNKQALWGPELFLVDDGKSPAEVVCSPRIGISKAKEFPWRYFWKGHPSVSRAMENKKALPVFHE